MASFSAELIARLGLDTTRFQRGLASIGPSLDAATSTIQKKFSGTNLFKGILQGIGIGSVQQIADAFVEPFREAAKSAEDIASATERSLSAMEQMLALRRTPEQNLAALQNRANNLSTQSRDLNNPANATLWERAQQMLNAMPVSVPGLSTLVNRRADRVRGERGARAADVAAEQQQNFLAQERLRKEIADKAEKSTRELAAAQKSYDEARQRRLVAEATAEGKVALAAQAMLEAQRAVANTTAGSKDNLEALTELEQKRLALVTAQDALSQERHAALEKEARQLERIADLTDRAADAQESLNRAKKADAEARGDRLAFSLADAAAGIRGSSDAKFQAREILKLEEQARVLRDRGAGSTQQIYDAKTGRYTDVNSTYFEDRALKMRSEFDNLISSDRNPLNSTEEAIQASEKHLAEILTQLEAVSANTSGK